MYSTDPTDRIMPVPWMRLNFILLTAKAYASALQCIIE